MRPIDRIRRLHTILDPKHVTCVVDIGANPFAGAPPYGVFRRSDCCDVVGFEPLEEALVALQEQARVNDTFLPYAVGDGTAQKLYVTKNSGLVSTLRPLPRIGDLLGRWWQRATEVKEELKIKTKRLDDIDEVKRVDFLKIDIQGGELVVFQNGRQKMQDCVALQTELGFHPYYEGQPSFGSIQEELGNQGFIAHKFVENSAHPISHDVALPDDVKAPRSQITVADMIFIKDPTNMGDLTSEQIKHLALLSFAVFASYDLCLRCLSELRARGKIADADIELAVDLMPLDKKG